MSKVEKSIYAANNVSQKEFINKVYKSFEINFKKLKVFGSKQKEVRHYLGEINTLISIHEMVEYLFKYYSAAAASKEGQISCVENKKTKTDIEMQNVATSVVDTSGFQFEILNAGECRGSGIKSSGGGSLGSNLRDYEEVEEVEKLSNNQNENRLSNFGQRKGGTVAVTMSSISNGKKAKNFNQFKKVLAEINRDINVSGEDLSNFAKN